MFFILDKCVNCGACIQINCEIFDYAYDKVTILKEIDDTTIDDFYLASYICPVNAIKFT